MSEIEIRVENLREEVGKEIAERIDRSIRRAAGDLHSGMERSAKQKITKRRAVFTGELRRSFVGGWRPISGGYEVRLENTADHASYIDRGVRGTRGGSGPHKYTTLTPPLEALIPWVETKLRNWTILELGDGERELVPKR